jgi:hypothetical protein
LAEEQNGNEGPELRQAGLDAARLDNKLKEVELKIKELALTERPSVWQSVLISPAFLAAVVTVCVTAATSYITSVNARRDQKIANIRTAVSNDFESNKFKSQHWLEHAKYEEKIISGILLSSEWGRDGCVAAAKLDQYMMARMFAVERQRAVEELRDSLRKGCPPVSK